MVHVRVAPKSSYSYIHIFIYSYIRALAKGIIGVGLDQRESLEWVLIRPQFLNFYMPWLSVSKTTRHKYSKDLARAVHHMKPHHFYNPIAVCNAVAHKEYAYIVSFPQNQKDKIIYENRWQNMPVRVYIFSLA
jgi:hypothetical protein